MSLLELHAEECRNSFTITKLNEQLDIAMDDLADLREENELLRDELSRAKVMSDRTQGFLENEILARDEQIDELLKESKGQARNLAVQRTIERNRMQMHESRNL